MMAVTIDPSETRHPARAAPRPTRLRLVLLSGLGILGLAGFTALASSFLGGLAGPQIARASIRNVALTQKASEWPDLRDGIPALAPVGPLPARPEADSSPAVIPAQLAATPSVTAVPAPPVPTSPTVAPAPIATPAPKRIQVAVPPPPVRLPPIENATVLPPARPATLVPVARSAALIAPSPAETTRSRATSGTFTALPPSEREAPKRKPATAVAHTVKPSASKVAAAVAPAPQAEAEAEHTEVFGIKVPSLAPAGRKLVEGVEALGNAVKSLPDRF